MNSKKRFSCWIILLLSVLLTSCAGSLATLTDPEASQEFNREVVGRLEDGRLMGQTINVRRTPWNGIHLWLRPQTNPTGWLVLQVYDNPAVTEPLTEMRINQRAIGSGEATYISFDRVSASATRRLDRQSYFITLKAVGSPIEVLGRLEDAYANGSLYQPVDGALKPVNADLAFRLTYAYDSAALLDDLAAALRGVWLVVPFMLMLLLPGWLMLDRTGIRLDGGEQVAVSLGLSLAIIPLVLLWSTVLGLQWNRWMLMVVSVMMVGLFVWRMSFQIGRMADFWKRYKFPHHLTTSALAGVFLLSLMVRLAMVRDLAAPAWVDSVHHATITRLILEQGRFPVNYLPYLDVDAQKYHAGYHAGLAVFVSLAKIDLAQGMLLYGQALNALIVFAVYFLAKNLTGDQRAGVVAGMVAGLLTPMPAYYASWGRYTQLAGLLILPVIAILFQKLVTTPASLRKLIGMATLTAVSAAGLSLVHYRVAVFTVLLLLALMGCSLRWSTTWNLRCVQRWLAWGLITGGLALTLALPWAWPTLRDVFAPIVAGGTMPGEVFGDFSWSHLTAGMGASALWLAGVGLAWGLLRGQRWVAALALWTALLLLMANLGPLGVPGASIFSNNTSVVIIFFMPISILAGYAISQAFQSGRGWLPSRWIKTIQSGLLLLVIALGLVGAIRLLPLLRPSTLLFRAADRPALDWMQTNIPPDETVLINPFLWGYNLHAGSDGGFWVSPLAGRKMLPPPVIYGMSQPDEVRRINAVCQQVIANGANATALWNILQAQDIRYVYIGVRGGPISPAILHASSLFETLYQRDGAWVFRAKNNKNP